VRTDDLVTPRTEAWRAQIKWLIEDGSEVAEGERIVEFDNTAVAQTLEEKRLARIQREIDLESRVASLGADRTDKTFAVERAAIRLEKTRAEAAVPQELMSRRDWQERQVAHREAEAAHEKARLDLAAFETSSRSEIENLEIARDRAIRDIESAQNTIEALVLRAPKAGIAIIAENWNEDRKFQVGDTLWPGLTVATIPDLTSMEVIGYLADVDDGRIAPGLAARCILDTYPDRVFAGRVEEVASVADRRGFKARISLASSDPAVMRPGMSVRAEVIRRSWDRALIVPRQAVRKEDGKALIWKAGASTPVEIEVAACTSTECVVASGLGEGDRVRIR